MESWDQTSSPDRWRSRFHHWKRVTWTHHAKKVTSRIARYLRCLWNLNPQHKHSWSLTSPYISTWNPHQLVIVFPCCVSASSFCPILLVLPHLTICLVQLWILACCFTRCHPRLQLFQPGVICPMNKGVLIQQTWVFAGLIIHISPISLLYKWSCSL